MGFLDRLLGREEPQSAAPRQSAPAPGNPQRSDDEIAVERYRYLLRTAPPETIEQVHEEAFAKLTPEQRRLVFTQLSENAPAGEQPRGDDPRSLAQAATRSEIRQPGTLERSLGGGGGGAGGIGFGGMFASSLLGSVAGYVIGSAIVSSFLPDPVDQQASGADNSDGSGGDNSDGSGGDNSGSGDAGSGDVSSADGGGWDSGTASADGGGWGGGDFGGGAGGDFGGGDFGGF